MTYNEQLHGILPLVSIYDDDDDGWQPIVSYRGIPPALGDRLTISQEWIGPLGEGLQKKEFNHFVITGRHLIIHKTYGGSNAEYQKFEIGVKRANVSGMTVEETEDGPERTD